MLKLGKYSFGTGDRFAHQGEAQLKASILALDAGVELTHVWNKSNREHKIVKSEPPSVRNEADAAVTALGWKGQYLVDADHINLTTVDGFVESSDFFTLDVADYIGMAVDPKEKSAYLEKYKKYIGELSIPGIEIPFKIDQNFLSVVADKFLFATIEAGKIYRRIAKLKRNEDFVAEVSMDEVSEPQTPAELFFILGALADAGIPVQTIAPKFTGRFNKGVDRHAITEFNLPANLKLSVHSGSDKFSIYGSIKQLMKKYDAGVHVKTAGTTWLEELIGLAEAGGEGLELSKAIYAKALGRFDELTGPYATVIDIQMKKLPSVEEVNKWTGEKYANTVRHNQKHPDFNPHFRQLLHCGYKVAAEFDARYYDALVKYKVIIARNVTENLFDRHIKPIFI